MATRWLTVSSLRRHRYLILLVTLTASLLAESLSFDDVLWGAAREALVTISIVAVFIVVFDNTAHRKLAMTCAMLAVAAAWAQNVTDPQARVPIEIVHNALIALLFTFANVIILRHLFEHRRITIDAILGTICGYLLLAASFANIYAAVDLLLPNSFVVSTQLAGQMHDWDGRHAVFDYFSLVTLTSVGYGDITAARGPATALTALEAMFGQFYIAVVVAQLVGAKLAQALNGGEESQ